MQGITHRFKKRKIVRLKNFTLIYKCFVLYKTHPRYLKIATKGKEHLEAIHQNLQTNKRLFLARRIFSHLL